MADNIFSGLTIVINRSSQLCTEAITSLEEEEGRADADSDKEDDSMIQDAAPTATQLKISHMVDCVVKILTTFARGVMAKESKWCIEECERQAFADSLSSLGPEVCNFRCNM